MKYIILSLNILLLLSCSKHIDDTQIWESLYLDTEIYQLKFNGDSIYYLDHHLVNHIGIKSEFEPIHLKDDTLFINDSIPFILSSRPKLDGIKLPNIPANNEIRWSSYTSISVTYNQNYGYGNVYFGSTQIKFQELCDYACQSNGVNLFIDQNLPMHYFDSIRLNIHRYGTFKFNIISTQGNNSARFPYPFLEELSKPPFDTYNFPPPPPNRFSSICKMLDDSLFIFIELNEDINHFKIASQLSNNNKTVFTVLYRPESTVQQTFQPYFKLMNTIQSLRNDFSLEIYQTEFMNLSPEEKKLVKQKYPIRVLLVNKQLFDVCDL